MAKTKGIFSRTPQCSLNGHSRGVPWSTLFVIVVLAIVVLVMWGRVAKKMRLPHEAPPSNFPGVLLPHLGG